MEKVVVENLLSDERESQIQAANELANLGIKQRQKLAERGVIAPLISMLHSEDYEVTEAALVALLSLAFGSERLVYSVYYIFTCRLSRNHECISIKKNQFETHSCLVCLSEMFGIYLV